MSRFETFTVEGLGNQGEELSVEFPDIHHARDFIRKKLEFRNKSPGIYWQGEYRIRVNTWETVDDV